jgi:SAM-dependent methyltransferase
MAGSIAYFIIIALELLLAVYFFYTLVAIFKGAAPIPSRRSTVTSMLRLAELSPGQKLYDLGSGDGRILFAAAKQGAECTGFEINPFLYWYTRIRAWLARASKVRVLRADFWNKPIGEADVVTVYLVPSAMARLQAKAKAEMKPGTRIIAGVYPFPDWPPVKQDGRAYLYIV